MLPYLITSNEDSVALLELEDGRFQMLEQGPVARFASGYQYLLIDKALAKYLKSLKEGAANHLRTGCRPEPHNRRGAPGSHESLRSSVLQSR